MYKVVVPATAARKMQGARPSCGIAMVKAQQGDDEEPGEAGPWDNLEREIMEGYPLLIALPFRNMLEKKDPEARAGPGSLLLSAERTAGGPPGRRQ